MFSIERESALNRESFRLQVNLKWNANLKIFLTNFPKFDIKYSVVHRMNELEKTKSKGDKEEEIINEIYPLPPIIHVERVHGI